MQPLHFALTLQLGLALLLISFSSAAEPKTLEEALVSFNWTWEVVEPHPDPWDQRRFDKNGTATAWRRGEMKCSGTWMVTGPRTVTIQNLTPQKNVHILTFDSAFSSFKGVNSKGTSHYKGQRMSSAALVANTLSSIPSSPAQVLMETNPQQPRLEVLKEQGANALEWALSPLDEPLPTNIRQNLLDLREDLLDEAAKASKESAAAHALGSQFCEKLLVAIEERNQARARAGYTAAQADADIRVTSQALEARRNHQMSWPQYNRELSQRAELERRQQSGADLKKERSALDWATRTVALRSYLDDLYRQFRAALR